MPELKQTIRYCKAANGMAIAWSTMGSGPPVVECKVHGHLEEELKNVTRIPYLRAVSERHTLIRYDGLGTGLSDRNFQDISLENSVRDLEAVVDAAGLEKFALLARPPGCIESITYAARHPERVSRLIVIGGHAKGHPASVPSSDVKVRQNAIMSAVEVGFDDQNSAFRQLYLVRRFPRATPEEVDSMDRFARLATSGRVAAAMYRYQSSSDVSDLARRIRCPALILHSLRDGWTPFSAGRTLASLISDARFVALDSEQSDPIPSDPAFKVLIEEVLAFLDADDGIRSAPEFVNLTPRERDVLELIARGLDNLQIAAHLNIAEKTVRNNITPIFDKLGVENRAQAIVKARDAGFGAGSR